MEVGGGGGGGLLTGRPAWDETSTQPGGSYSSTWEKILGDTTHKTVNVLNSELDSSDQKSNLECTIYGKPESLLLSISPYMSSFTVTLGLHIS